MNHNDRLLCPVCGEFRFEKNNSFEICPVCGWENDLAQLEDPFFSGGANKLNLNESRLAYHKRLYCSEEDTGI